MENAKPRFRVQFSLLWIAAIVTIAALAVSNWQKSKELAAADAELYKLRSELGYLAVADKAQFHAIALDADEKDTWRWRIFIPKGNRYQWQMAVGELLPSALPTEGVRSSSTNEPPLRTDTEVLVTARLRKNEDKTWTLAVTSNVVGSSKHIGGVAMKNIPAEKFAWMNEIPSVENDVLGSKGTAVVPPQGPIILLKQRACERQPDGGFQPSANPQPGFMIWLESW